MRHVALTVTLVASLAGCMVGPDYTKPEVDAPQAYRYEPKQTAETANTDWWTQFGDPVLDQLVAEALANNKTVQIAAANVEQAAGVLTQTRAPLYPQVGYRGDAGRERLSEKSAFPPAPGTQNPANHYQVLAGASWEIDLWGRVRRLSEAAQANLFATEQARRGVVLTLVASIGASYLQLRGLDQQLEIATRTRDAYAASVKLFELKFEHGQISQMNVEQVRVQYETAAAQIPQIRTQIAQTENALSILLGRNPGPIARGKSILELTLPQIPAGLPSQLLERRPDLLQAEQQLIAANAQIGAAKALYYPTISLTGAFGSASAQLGNLFSGPAQTWAYAGSIIGPIFTAGAISGQVTQATAAQKAALLSYQLSIQSAFADVENALVSRQELSDQVAAQERLVRALQEYSRLAYLQYDGGYAPYTDVLQAEQQLFPAELNLAAVRTQQLASLVRIYQATGGGWVDVAQKSADAAAQAREEAKTAGDRIEMPAPADAPVINVYRVRGAGGVEVRKPEAGWPATLALRLHGFTELGSVSAMTQGTTLACAARRTNGEPGALTCTLAGKPVEAATRTPVYSEIMLPAALLRPDARSIKLRWAEQGKP